MRAETLSDRAQQGIRAAEAYALDLRQGRVVPAHLLVALLSDERGAVPAALRRLGADPVTVQEKVHRELKRLSADGGATPAWDVNLRTVLDAAWREAQRQRDDLLRTSHLLLAIVDGPYDLGRKALHESGVTRAGVEYALRAEPGLAAAERRGVPVQPGGNGHPAGSAAPGTDATQPGGTAASAKTAPVIAEHSMLAQYGRNLTQLARDGALDPIVGRDDEIRRVMQVLGRRSRNNPVLVGEPGVGKTAIVEGLAQRIAAGEVPAGLKDRQIVQVDLGSLVAGTGLRGQFEERIKKLVGEVAEAQGAVLLFFDEVHTLASAGGKEGGGAADLLKPALARGQLSLIGTTTPGEFRRHIEADKALHRRFQEIAVEEPTEAETLAILQGIATRYETHHRVRIHGDALRTAVRLSTRYVLERRLPDKAIDLLDEAASRLRMEIDAQPLQLAGLRRDVVNLRAERESLRSQPQAYERANALEKQIRETEADIERRAQLLEREKAANDELAHLMAQLEATRGLVERAQQEGDLGRAAELKYGVVAPLERDIEAATQRVEALHNSSSGPLIREEVGEQDVAVVVGEWTGIPTTRMLESERLRLLAFEERLGERVIGQPQAVTAIAAAVRRSRAGLQDRNRPIGNFFFVGPTGVGKTELAKALAVFLFDSEDALIRIDMSEYMEQSKVNTLIGAAYGYVDSDKGGILTEAVRKRPYSVVLFDEAEKAHPDVFNLLLQVLDEGRLTDSQGRRIDFTNTIIIMTSNVGARRILDLTGKVTYEELDTQVHEILRDHFKPEFLNRLDDTVVFNALDRPSLTRIFAILERGLQKLLAEQQLSLQMSEAARQAVIDRGYQPEYGARPLKRALLTMVQDPLATLVLLEAFRPGDTILADLEGDALVFRRQDGASAE